MNVVLQPWQLLFAILYGWMHSRQQQIIEFQNDQLISLMKSQGKKRVSVASRPVLVLLGFGDDLGGWNGLGAGAIG